MIKQYIVKSVQASEEGVILELIEYETTIEPKMERIPKDQTEKTVASIFKAVQKMTGAPMKPTKYYPFGYEPHVIRAWLTLDEYQKLGKPTVGDDLQLTIKKREKVK